jgi:uncharacterized membrane protein YfcA
LAEHALLALIVFLVAIWNASVGPSGAITFASMAIILPPFTVIPIHAAVEGVAAFLRTVLLRKYVDWFFVRYFTAGAFLGFLTGAPLFYSLSLTEGVLRVVLGISILLITWARFPRFSENSWKRLTLLGGFSTSFLTIFIGATSSLVAALVQQNRSDHRQTLGTSSICMAIQHGGKIPVFGLLGFSFVQYGELLAHLILASFIGSWIGRYLLISVPQKITRSLFKLVLTVIAFYLIWLGFTTV